MKVEYPKVLVISHNAFSNTQNNGKTLAAFFKEWPKSNIAQLYITPEEPDMTICNNFYRITDLEVLKQFFNRKEMQLDRQDKKNEEEKVNENRIKTKMINFIKKIYAKKIPFFDFIRNMIWTKVKPWRNKSVQEWIKKFNPDVIFFQTSNLYAIFDMVKEIKEITEAELFLETTDDYVTKHFSLDPFYLFNINKNIERYRNLVNTSKAVFVIGDLMLEEYSKRFNGNYIVAMNSVEISNKVVSYENIKNEIITMVYAGNLGLNRWKVLATIGKVLKELNKKENIKVQLHIYSINEPNEYVKKRLIISTICEYKGRLSSEELIEVKNKADILVHVESFDKKNKKITRLSVSTKIPEYMLSQRCILAIGPEDIASIKYIKDYKIGEVINTLDKRNIKKQIYDLIKNRDKMEKYIANAVKVANERHDFEINRRAIQNEIINYRN